ncbi:hypothetical protein [Granulicella sp. S190]|uniref:hypothetical protein n=1 Tax=Granulicella sp. S190 TaxID=1747226 RepID=UPI00131B91AE|nr:hypothetical protein [Granulicella sp. S190]
MTWLRNRLLLLAVAKDSPHDNLVMEREHQEGNKHMEKTKADELKEIFDALDKAGFPKDFLADREQLPAQERDWDALLRLETPEKK